MIRRNKSIGLFDNARDTIKQCMDFPSEPVKLATYNTAATYDNKGQWTIKGADTYITQDYNTAVELLWRSWASEYQLTAMLNYGQAR